MRVVQAPARKIRRVAQSRIMPVSFYLRVTGEHVGIHEMALRIEKVGHSRICSSDGTVWDPSLTHSEDDPSRPLRPRGGCRR